MLMFISPFSSAAVVAATDTVLADRRRRRHLFILPNGIMTIWRTDEHNSGMQGHRKSDRFVRALPWRGPMRCCGPPCF